MRISRPCYDKYHRCPGWAGGGLRYAKRKRCDGGSLGSVIDYDSRWWRWRVHRCPVCDVYVLPYNIRQIDPTWWRSEIQHWWRYTRLDWAERIGHLLRGEW